MLVEAVEDGWAYTCYNGNYGWAHTNYMFDDPYLVRQVQTALNAAGFNCGAPDGSAGANTHAAMHSYQAAHGLQVTDRITQELVASLGIK